MTDAVPDEGSRSNLATVLELLLPEKRTSQRRLLIGAQRTELTFDALKLGIEEVGGLGAEISLGEREISALVDELMRYEYKEPEQSARLLQLLRDHVSARWGILAEPLARRTIENVFSKVLFRAFPALRSDPTTLRIFSSRLTHDEHFSLNEAVAALAEIRVSTIDQARMIIVAGMNRRAHSRRSEEEEQEKFFAVFFSLLGREIGWSRWVKLFSVLLGARMYADPIADVCVDTYSRTEAQEVIVARQDLARELKDDISIRDVAARLRDLLDGDDGWSNDGLLGRPAETRAAFVAGLFKAVATDRDMRRAAVEALLWLPNRRAIDLAQFTAIRLIDGHDCEFLSELSFHPERLVCYGAEAVKRAVFGARFEYDIPHPRGGASVIESLLQIDGLPPRPEEPSRTWLGDRIVEQLIEHAVSRIENRFGREYVEHGEEGEEKILAMMFEALSARFEALDLALEATARAVSAPRRAHVSMRYRTIDKAEEGRQGVKRAKSFSADLCLIVDPVLDGRSLGRRVTLVQAKRLYRDKRATSQPAWHHSFHLKVGQMKDLIRQTRSAVYFFQGPILCGRGVPVIPAQLVSDLASHQGGTGAALARDTVAIASRSLADWFTYDLLALRIGDPMQELIEKAEGSPGALPRRLLALPRVEIEIGMQERSEASRR